MTSADSAGSIQRYSKKEPGKVIGHAHRTVVDLSVWDVGRIVFNAQPTLGAGMEDYTVADAGIVVVNEGAGALDLSWAQSLPDQQELAEHTRRTGQELRLKMSRDNGSLALHIEQANALELDTEITHRGTTQTLAEWVATIKPGDKLRCEAPFRFSESEAAFIRVTEHGLVFVHDVGNRTTYYPTEAAQAEFTKMIALNQKVTETGPPSSLWKISQAQAASWEAISSPVKAQKWVLEGWLLAGTVGVLAAAGGASKTTLMLDLAICIALGRDWMDVKPTMGSTVIVSNDDPAEDLRTALRLVAQSRMLTEAEWEVVTRRVIIVSHYGNPQAPRFVTKARTETVVTNAGESLLEELQDVSDLRLIVMDTLRQFSGGDSNDEIAMRASLDSLRLVSDRHPARPAALFSHHTGKDAFRNGLDDQYSVLGSSAITDNARAVFLLQRVDQGAIAERVAVDGATPEASVLRLRSARGSLLYRNPDDMFITREGYEFKPAQGRTLSKADRDAKRREEAEQARQNKLQANRMLILDGARNWNVTAGLQAGLICNSTGLARTLSIRKEDALEVLHVLSSEQWIHKMPLPPKVAKVARRKSNQADWLMGLSVEEHTDLIHDKVLPQSVMDRFANICNQIMLHAEHQHPAETIASEQGERP